MRGRKSAPIATWWKCSDSAVGSASGGLSPYITQNRFVSMRREGYAFR